MPRAKRDVFRVSTHTRRPFESIAIRFVAGLRFVTSRRVPVPMPNQIKMSSLVFRDAARADIGALLEIIHAGALESGRYPDEDETDPGVIAGFDAIAADPNNRLIAVERDGEIVGTFQISFLPGIVGKGMWRGQLESVHVRATFRGQGIGGEMVRWAIAHCAERGCGTIQFTSNKKRKDAHRFYERLGFEKSHDGFKMTL